VDNAADEAYKPLSEAIAAAKGVDAKLIIAPQATCSSQKIQKYAPNATVSSLL
jgi:hypothetical protein